MVKVRISSALKDITNGKYDMECSSGTVGELIEELNKEHPGIKQKLIDKDGKLGPYIIINVNGEDIRLMDGLDTRLTNTSHVSLVPAMSGG